MLLAIVLKRQLDVVDRLPFPDDVFRADLLVRATEQTTRVESEVTTIDSSKQRKQMYEKGAARSMSSSVNTTSNAAFESGLASPPPPPPAQAKDSYFYADGSPKHTLSDRDSDLLWNNYADLLEKGRFGSVGKKMPSLQVFQQYMDYHGRDRLELEWKVCQEAYRSNRGGHTSSKNATWADLQEVSSCRPLLSRKFVVGKYSCPLEAGNRLVKYMNHLIWAIATGRTFLSGYWDETACRKELNKDSGTYNNDKQPDEYCRYATNSQQDCDEVLRLRSWIPSEEDWKDRLDLEDPIRVDGINPKGADAMGRPYDQEAAPRVIRVGQQTLLTTALHLHKQQHRHKLLREGKNRRVTQLLLTDGYLFVYGMLFEFLFVLQPAALPDPYLVADPNVYQTVALHSRHPHKIHDGSNIEPETRCLNAVIPGLSVSTSEETMAAANSTTRPIPCIVYVMSDREASVAALKERIRQYSIGSISNHTVMETNGSNCVPIVANHSSGSSFQPEHGSFAGLGYFQDLALARHARSGFIAPHASKRAGKGIRTSSGLLRSVIEFRRKLEQRGGIANGFDGKVNETAISATTPTPLVSCTNPHFDVDVSNNVRLN